MSRTEMKMYRAGREHAEFDYESNVSWDDIEDRAANAVKLYGRAWALGYNAAVSSLRAMKTRMGWAS